MTKHGLSLTAKQDYSHRRPIYLAWVNMRQRCNNPNRPDYRYYGGRGINVCKRWDEFINFYNDMGLPKAGESLDRIDNNKDYSPDNCKWSTRKEQSNNRNYNRQITHKGITQSVGKWASEAPIEISTRNLYKRIITRKWDIERALTQPLKGA